MDKPGYTVTKLVNNDSFRRWVNGKAEKEEVLRWDRWVARHPANERLARRAQQQITGFSFRPVVRSSTDANWNRLREEIVSASASAKKDYQRSKAPKVRRLWPYYAAAAVFLVVFTASLAGLFYDWENKTVSEAHVVATDVTTGFGERKTIRLSDGSTIILNANSSVNFASDPNRPLNVRVKLQGEAFFQVTDRSHPDEAFIVQTRDGMVHVLGTKFVVTDRSHETQVVLAEGSVAVQAGLETNPHVILHTIKPGQMASFRSNSDTVRVTSVNPAVYTSWTTHTLVFDNTPLRQIIRRLEYTFGAKITVNDPSLYDRRLSGTVKNSNLAVIAEAVARSLLIECEVQGQQVSFGPAIPFPTINH